MKRTFNLGDIVRVTNETNNVVFLSYVTETIHKLGSDGKAKTLYQFTYDPNDDDSFYHKGVNEDDNDYFIGDKLGNITQNQSEEKTNIIQVTCMERTKETEKTFSNLMNYINSLDHAHVILEMSKWPKSDLAPMTYTHILELAEDGERILFDNGTYILTASDHMIVLYEREE